MKKFIYYTSPFVLIPVVLLSIEYIDNTTALPLFPFFIILPIFFPMIMGIFSPTHKRFDYIMTAIMPLSLFCFMFISGFLDKSDLGSRFHLHRALDVSSQSICLIAYCIMAAFTFLSSYKKFRIIKNKQIPKY